MNPAQPNNFDEQMSGFIQTLDAEAKLDLPGVLTELVAGAVRTLPPARHAGITVSDGARVSTGATTGPLPKELDKIQQQCGMGPCLTAARADNVVRVDDLAHESRWPAYTRAALAQTPVRSVLSLALTTDSPDVSALNVY